MTRPTRQRARPSPPTLAAVLALLAALLVLPLALAPRAEAFVYWTNSRRHGIGRANLDGRGVDQRFIDLRPSRRRGASTVDARHIYWTRAENGIRPRQARRYGRRQDINHRTSSERISVAVCAGVSTETSR